MGRRSGLHFFRDRGRSQNCVEMLRGEDPSIPYHIPHRLVYRFSEASTMADQNNINEFCIHGKITGWTSYFRSAKFSSTPIITLDNAGIDVLSKLVRAKPQL